MNDPERFQLGMQAFMDRLAARDRENAARDKALLEKNGPCPFNLTLDPYEYEQYLNWTSQHKCKLTTPTEENPFPGGAIGGATSLEFTFTSLGAGVSVKCVCGEEENITNYDAW